ncbi:MAG: penicillin-binding protein 1C [Anaerolineae bacterium]|nr:penicillin-binding protein 1C [Anaerolineae bacterium]
MRNSRKKVIWSVLLAILAITIVSAAELFHWALKDLPDAAKLTERLNPPSMRITDREGRLLYEILPAEGGRHTPLPLEVMPLALRQATIATEDSSFYLNPGVDLVGILRALWINLRGGEVLAGGSTLTQQVARNLLLEEDERNQRILRRKLREIALAWQITRRYSKDEVLALYLNQTYYGKLAYGVEAAAQTYFGKPVSELDVAECALLAGLPQAPALYDPFDNLEAAKSRQKTVLGLMVKQGYLTAEEANLAARERLKLAESPYPMDAPHFVMMVRSQLDRLFTPEELRAGRGLEVRTTLNLDWQRLAEQAVSNQLERLRTQTDDPFGHNVNSAALVAIDPRSGEILAMVGSPDYFNASQAGAVNMALSPRQPGSALKPLIYAAAFDPQRPQPWSPGTMILDVTTHFETHDGKPYTPVNYDGLEHGPVLAREALASSLNVPAVIALEHVGLPAFYSFASRLGITTLEDPYQADLSVALGGGEVRLLELTAAYGAFANGGYRVSPFAILEISDNQGKTYYRHLSEPAEKVLDARVAWLITDILSDDNARLIGFGRDSILRLDRPAAVKTGTTTNFHDNWTIGYTPSLVVGVWVGNTSHEAMHNITGLTGAAPIWAQMMRSVLSARPEEAFTRPDGLIQLEICGLSGKLPTPACPNRRLEWFIPGTQPRSEDSFYRLAEIDQATSRLADESTPPERRVVVTAVNLPPQAERWARAHGLTVWSDLTSQAASATTATEGGPIAGLRLLSPAPNAVFFLSDKLPLEAQQLRLQASGLPGGGLVTFYVDGTPVAVASQPPYEAWWQIEKGNHTAWAASSTEKGERFESNRVRFEVR